MCSGDTTAVPVSYWKWATTLALNRPPASGPATRIGDDLSAGPAVGERPHDSEVARAGQPHHHRQRAAVEPELGGGPGVAPPVPGRDLPASIHFGQKAERRPRTSGGRVAARRRTRTASPTGARSATDGASRGRLWSMVTVANVLSAGRYVATPSARPVGWYRFSDWVTSGISSVPSLARVGRSRA
jgi:hypothetical protein